MISFQGVSKIYPPDVVALDNVSLDIQDNEFVSITGRSGAGKTTLIKLLLGEEKPSSGKVLYQGQDVGKIRPRYLPSHRRNFGAVFQDFKLLKHRTVYENVAFALEVQGILRQDIDRHVPEALQTVEMLDKAHNFPHQLSGGEQQRVVLARAIIHRPKVLIADEPTGNLDPYNTWEIVKLLLKIHQLGTTVILATHNREIINFLEKRVITFDKGRVIRDVKKGRYVL